MAYFLSELLKLLITIKRAGINYFMGDSVVSMLQEVLPRFLFNIIPHVYGATMTAMAATAMLCMYFDLSSIFTHSLDSLSDALDFFYGPSSDSFHFKEENCLKYPVASAPRDITIPTEVAPKPTIDGQLCSGQFVLTLFCVILVFCLI
jgi:hypothetical protein